MICYSSWMMYQAILSGIHTPLIGVSTHYLDCNNPAVLPFSFLGRLMPLLISGGDLLILRSCDLGPLGILCYYPILESLDILQLLFLLLRNPPLFSFFPGFGLCLSPSLLSCILYMTGLHCLLQTKERLLLLLVLLLYFTVLLLKHFSIMLRNVGRGRRRHNNTETRAKKLPFSFIYCWPRYHHRIFGWTQ